MAYIIEQGSPNRETCSQRRKVNANIVGGVYGSRRESCEVKKDCPIRKFDGSTKLWASLN
jgi:hypothetical protein